MLWLSAAQVWSVAVISFMCPVLFLPNVIVHISAHCLCLFTKRVAPLLWALINDTTVVRFLRRSQPVYALEAYRRQLLILLQSSYQPTLYIKRFTGNPTCQMELFLNLLNLFHHSHTSEYTQFFFYCHLQTAWGLLRATVDTCSDKTVQFW